MSQQNDRLDVLTRLGRLRRMERGAALTEFVITLPIFIMIFSAVIWIGQSYQKMVETNIRANIEMWNWATNVQTNRTPGGAMENLNPVSSVGPLGERLSTEGLDGSGAAGAAVNSARALRGTHGESYVFLRPAQASNTMPISRDQLKDSPDEYLRRGRHRSFAMGIINDSPLSDGSKRPGGGGGAFTRLVPDVPAGLSQGDNGFVQAMGANIRWGSAYGDYSEEYKAGNIAELDFRAHFYVMVPPYAPQDNTAAAADELLTTGTSRMLGMTSRSDCWMAEIPGVQRGNDYARCR